VRHGRARRHPPLNAASVIIIVRRLTCGEHLDVSAALPCRDDGGNVGGSGQYCLCCGGARPKTANRFTEDVRFGIVCTSLARPILRWLREGTGPRFSNESVPWAGGRRSLNNEMTPIAFASVELRQHRGRAPHQRRLHCKLRSSLSSTGRTPCGNCRQNIADRRDVWAFATIASYPCVGRRRHDACRLRLRMLRRDLVIPVDFRADRYGSYRWEV
jgi:hypothetical protein